MSIDGTRRSSPKVMVTPYARMKAPVRFPEGDPDARLHDDVELAKKTAEVTDRLIHANRKTLFVTFAHALHGYTTNLGILENAFDVAVQLKNNRLRNWVADLIGGSLHASSELKKKVNRF